MPAAEHVTPRTYTVAAVAERYGVSEPTITAWIRSGELRAVNVGRAAGKKKPRWRITAEALAAFEAARSSTPAPMPSRSRRTRRPTADTVRFY